MALFTKTADTENGRAVYFIKFIIGSFIRLHKYFHILSGVIVI